MNIPVFLMMAFFSPALAVSPLLAQDDTLIAQYPHTVITNGIVEASVFLPDSEKGFYRSSRYDWSGIIGQLTFKGHTYFMKRRGDFPLFGFNFYSDVNSVCPEFFIFITIEPGKTAKWTRTYSFFTE